MFGRKPAPPKLPSTDRLITPLRDALVNCARYLTNELRAHGVSSGRLAEEGLQSGAALVAQVDDAIAVEMAGEPHVVMISRTDDFATHNFRPHFRLREVQYVIGEMEGELRAQPERRRDYVLANAPHALFQTQMLRLFLIRAPAIEEMSQRDDFPQLKEEFAFTAKNIAGLMSDIPQQFRASFDVDAGMREWIFWPKVRLVPLRSLTS